MIVVEWKFSLLTVCLLEPSAYALVIQSKVAEIIKWRWPRPSSSLENDNLFLVTWYFNYRDSRLRIDNFSSCELECAGSFISSMSVLDIPSMVETVHDNNRSHLAKDLFLFFGMPQCQIYHSFSNLLQTIPFEGTNCDWLWAVKINFNLIVLGIAIRSNFKHMINEKFVLTGL